MSITVSAADLTRFVVLILTRLDVPGPDATVVADCLVSAELEGHGSHGVMRLPFYANRVRKGLIDPHPRMRVDHHRVATATLDAGNALGPLAGRRAMELALHAAQDAGLGMCAVRASNHLGALSYYVKQASACGMIGLAFTNTPPAMAPPGGKEPYLGTNPIAAAVPASGHPLVIDLATSQVARGQILRAAKAEQDIPLGWALDPDGLPTTNATTALSGSLVPLGGTKGFALALLVEVLSGVLSGAGVGPEVSGTFAPSDSPSNVGHSMIAIDPQAFGDGFTERVDGLCRSIRNTPGADPATPVRLPGDRAHEERVRRQQEGIVLLDRVAADLSELAREVGVPGLV